MPFTGLVAELAALEARGLKRHRRVLETPQGARVVVDGREFLAFCSNDYLGLAGDARLLSRASFKRYAHGDLAALEKLLAASQARRKLVATDAVFSMDGDIAPVPALLRLCE